jgi:two-component Ni(II)/redox sensor kinase NrsS
LRWILIGGFPLALGLIAVSSSWLSGLAMQPIYQSYQQQQQFTANAAHELRSPLASLLATVEAISRVSSSDQQTIPALLTTVERQGRRLSTLINDLLLLSSLEQNSSSTSFQACCLNDLIRDLTEEFLELAIAADLTLASTIPDPIIQVLGDEPQLYRLASNLISNAIHFTPAGGKIWINLEQHDRMALITVQDTGIGIPSDDLPRIFERFYRGNSDRSRKTGGTGLGLAIVQAIAHRHRGYLTVTSHLAQGSTFTVHLPTRPQKIEH